VANAAEEFPSIRTMNLAVHLAEVSGVPLSDEPMESVLQRVTDVAARAIPGNDGVSVTLLARGGPTTAAFHGRLAMEADERQYGTGEGPCLAAASSGEPVVVSGLADDDRWPEYAAKATALGVSSSVSVPLQVRDRVLGALNVYSRWERAFTDEDVELASAFAAHAAVAIANADLYAATVTLAQQLDTALSSRAVIEQAKGILMARQRVTADEAFDVLRVRSQNTNRKLREVAFGLVETGDWPAWSPRGESNS
jgi:GAF domain-containing protein